MTALPPSIPASLRLIPGGKGGVDATLAAMVKLANRYKTHPLIRELAKALVHDCPERAPDCEAAALQAYVRDQVRYTGDVADVETLQTPLNTLGLIEQADGSWIANGDPPRAAGDCDDKATLLAALLLAVGIKGAFCAVQIQGGPYSHVLVQARIRRRGVVDYVPLETIVPDVGPGWFPPDATCMRLAHFA